MFITKRLSNFLSIFVASILLISCSGGIGLGSDGTDTLGDYDIELPEGAESKLPMPKDSSIMLSFSEDGTHGITFKPGQSYPESVELFTDYFESSDWTVNEEDIPENEDGEREASWSLSNDALNVYVSITAFGDKEGSNMTGSYSISEIDEDEQEDELADYTRQSKEGQIELNYKELDNTSPTDEYLPNLDLLTHTILDGAIITNYRTYDKRTREDDHGHTLLKLFYEDMEIIDVVEQYERAEENFDEVEMAPSMEHVYNRMEEFEELLEAGEIDEEEFEIAVDVDTVKETYALNAFNDEGAVNIQVGEIETIDIDGGNKEGVVVTIEVMEKGYGNWEEIREQNN